MSDSKNMSVEVTREAAEAIINPRVDELFAVLKSAKDELASIRGTCSHPSYFLAHWEWGVARFSACRVCAVCRNHIEGITDEERARLGPLFPEQDSTWKFVHCEPES